MKMNMRIAFVALAAATLLGCGQDPPDLAHAGRVQFTDPTEQEQMKAALTKAGIHFEVHTSEGGQEQIVYESQLQDEVIRVRNELFGVPPAIGRNIVLSAESTALFAEEMGKRGAAFRTGTYHGSQYVAWAPESDEAADAALEAARVGSEMLTEMRRQRMLADAEQANRTDRSSRSRQERAPAER
jgi:hypothetical protein